MTDIDLNLDDIGEKEKMKFGINTEGMTETEKMKLAKRVGVKLNQPDEPVSVGREGPHGLGTFILPYYRPLKHDLLRQLCHISFIWFT